MPGGARYSPLTQITRENVRHLDVAWSYHTGDVSEGGPDTVSETRSSFQAIPIPAVAQAAKMGLVYVLDGETAMQLLPQRETWGSGSTEFCRCTSRVWSTISAISVRE